MSFQIYTDRLKSGQVEHIDESVPSDFLDVKEEALSFPDPIHIQGEAYLTDDHLVLHLTIKVTAQIPCSICNEPVKLNFNIKDFYHAEPLSEIVGHIFDYSAQLRESISLQVPAFAECHQGTCPERKEVNKYLKQTSSSEPSHFPFADLN